MPDLLALIQAGRSDDAERQLRQRLLSFPDDVDSLHILGLLCHQSGRSADAVALIGRALKFSPGAAYIHSNFAEALRKHGDLASAEQHARRAVSLAPAHPDFQLNLATVLVECNRLSEAIEVSETLLAAEPHRFEALTLKSEACFRLERNAEALESAEQACRRAPENLGLLANLLRQRAWVCEWRYRASDVAIMTALLEKLTSLTKTTDDGVEDTPVLGGLSPFVCHEYRLPSRLRAAVTELCVDNYVPADILPMNTADGFARLKRKRLRIGYLSADFHNHPTMHLMAGLFELHDRARFETYAYSIGPDDGSEYRRRARESVDRFIDIRGATTPAAAEQIFSDGIDILVDLKGFTHEARPGILALCPAPLQVAWLGYPASTGRRLNDYMIVDRITVPVDDNERFGEKLVWMPHSYQVNDHRQPVAGAAVGRRDFGLPEKGFVFACFNQVYKIEPDVFALWMRILGRVPESVLWLYSSNATARANLAREAAAHGIAPSRILFGSTLDKPHHLARLSCADIFLDTGTVNAHTSASDALWAGVPVLTRPGESFAARVGASLVSAAGLPQLVCGSAAQYEDMAVRLANAPAELGDLRKVLSKRAQLPLFDTPRFSRNLERAFEMMWLRYISGQPPASFDVADVYSDSTRAG